MIPKIRSRYYKSVGHNIIPIYWLPGKFYQIKSLFHYVNNENRWRPCYFAWYPRTPCHFCDKIEIFHFPIKSTPKLWRLSYVELGIDADKYNLPLGLKFSKGRAHTLPVFAKQIIVHILKFFDDNNICTSVEEMDYLVENNYMFPYYDNPNHIMDTYEGSRSKYAITLIDVECVWQTSNLKEKKNVEKISGTQIRQKIIRGGNRKITKSN